MGCGSSNVIVPGKRDKNYEVRVQNFINESNVAAEELGFLSNSEVFTHPLNILDPSSKDPRSMQQLKDYEAEKESKIQLEIGDNKKGLVLIDCLEGADFPSNLLSKECYLRISCSGQKARTKKVKGCNPIWEEAKELLVELKGTEGTLAVIIECMGNNKSLGRISIDLSISNPSYPPIWYPLLIGKEGQETKGEGKLLIATDFIPDLQNFKAQIKSENFLEYQLWPPVHKLGGKSRYRMMKESLAHPPSTPMNPEELGSALISYSPLLPYILKTGCGDWLSDKMLGLGRVFEAPVVDRTDTLGISSQVVEGGAYYDYKLKIENKYPIPGLDPAFKKNLSTLMLERAEDILKTYPNQELYLLWSGGIDTTAMVTAFLRLTENSPEDRGRLIATFCWRSKQEYPFFYEIYISQMKTHIIEGHVRDVLDGNKIIVTGDPADMIFGTYLMGKCLVQKDKDGKDNPLFMNLDSPWKTIIPIYISHLELLPSTKKAHEEWLKWIEPFALKSPIPILSVFDFFWWGSFALKYQHDLNRIFYNREEDQVPQTIIQKVNNFYNTEDFQQWSYHNHNIKMGDHRVWASYKQPLKQFIMEFTNDKEYYSVKLKSRSVINSWGYDVAMDSNYNLIKWGRYSISQSQLAVKYPQNLLQLKFVEKTLLPTPKRGKKGKRRGKSGKGGRRGGGGGGTAVLGGASSGIGE